MSILHVNQISGALHRMFDGLIDLTDAPPNPDEKEKLFLTRALAAFAISQLAAVSPQEAGQAVTDGSGDNGIDALHYDRPTKTMYIVQAKWHGDGNGAFDREAILKFTKGGGFPSVQKTCKAPSRLVTNTRAREDEIVHLSPLKSALSGVRL